MRKYLLALAILCSMFVAATAWGAERGRGRSVNSWAAQRQSYANTPWMQRGYRPFHFFGNTVRFIYHRGSFTPRGGSRRTYRGR